MGILSQTHNGLNFVDSQAYIQADGTTVITIKDDGKVGIGASDPLRTLHVVGDFSVNASTSQYYGVLINGGESSNPQITIGDWHNSSATIMWDSTSNHLVIDSQHSTSGAAIVFTGNDSATEYMRITSGGNVGIGTTSPSAKLSLEGGDELLELNTTLATGSPYLNFQQAGTRRAYIQLHDSGNNLKLASEYGKISLFTGDSNNEVERLTVTSAGNVGIGTTSPSQKLDVAGNIQVNGNNILFDEGTNAQSAIISSVSYLEIKGNYASPSDGARVWVGKGDTVDSGFYVNASQHFFRGLDSSTKMYISTGTGNVGIGTTSPGSKLEVNGTLKASGAVTLSNYASGLLQVDASGVVSVDSSSYSTFSGDYADLTNKPSIPVSGTDFDPVGTDNSTNVTLVTTSHDYLSLSGQAITLNAINLDDINGGATAGLLQTDANGVVSVDTSTYSTFSGSYSDLTNKPLIDTWYSSGTYTYVAPTVYYYYIKVANISGGTSIGKLEYYCKKDSNYPGAVTGNVHLASYNASSMSIQHDQLGGNGDIQPQVYIDNNRDVWLRMSGSAWNSFLRWRFIYSSGITIYDGTTKQTTQPADSAIVYASQSIRFTWNDVTASTTYGNRSTVDYLTANRTATLNSDLTVAGNVGIGTTSPSHKLHVVSSGTNQVQIDGSGSQSMFSYSDSGGVGWCTGSGSGNWTNLVYLDTNNDAVNIYANDSFHTTFTAQGNVGIGTTNPNYKLDVSGTSRIGGTSSNLALFVTSTSTFGAAISYEDTNTGGNDVVHAGAIGSGFYIATGWSERLRILSDGKVGIGTTNPGSKLEVSGNTKITGNAMVNAQVQAGYAVSTTDARISAGEARTGSGNAYIDLIGDTTYSTYGLRLQRAGGANSSSYLSHRGTGTMYIRTMDSASLSLKTADTDRLTIASGGNVGISQTLPSYKLDVTGDIRATGDITANSDARLKENVETIPDALKKVTAMRGVTFNKIGEEKRSVGVIAQELLEVLPEAVRQDNEGIYNVAYGNITGVLIEAIKELTTKVESLEEQLKNK